MNEKDTPPRKPSNTTSSPKTLREQAEDIFRQRTSHLEETLKDHSPEELKRMLHELRVSQIELEMQNEELLRAQNLVDASRERYFDLYDLAPVGYLTLSETGMIRESNFAAAALLGVSRRALIKLQLTRFICPEDQDLYDQRRNTQLETAHPQSLELRMLGRKNKPFWAHLEITSAQDDSNTPEFRIILTNISERKEAEEARNESVEFSMSVINSMLDGFSLLDLKGVAVDVNPALCKMTGFSREELVGSKPPHPYWPPEQYEQIQAALEKTLLGGISQFELIFMRRNGERFPVIVSPFGVKDRNGKTVNFAATVKDITKRKQAEEALRASDAFQRDILNSLPAHIAVLDKTGKILKVNEPWLRFARTNGNPLVEKIGKGADYFEVCHTACHEGDSYANAAVAGIKSVLSGEQKLFTMEYPCDGPDCGRWFAMEVLQPMESAVGAIVAHTDITARKQAEIELLDANQKLRLHFDQTPLAFIEWDLDFRVAEWNHAARTIFGYAREEALGRHASFIVPESFRPQVNGVMRALLTKSGGERSSNANVSKDGTPILCEWYNTPLTDELGTVVGVASVIMDITEQTETLHLLDWEKNALETIVSAKALPEVLESLVLTLEMQLPDALCSILLLDEDGIHMRHGAAPNLPAAYNEVVNGIPIGPATGSCGTAAYEKRQVIVQDIATDPLWADYRELALQHDLHACWSTPVIDSEGAVLGTFAIYYRQPRKPTAFEIELIERAVHISRLAIERKHSEERIRSFSAELEQRVAQRTAELQGANALLNDFKSALDAHALVTISDSKGIINYANEKFCTISKYSNSELIGQDHRIVNSGYHPAAFFEDLWQTVMSGRIWKAEMKNRAKDGSCFWVSTTIVPFLSHGGKPGQFVAIRTDITERKLAEEALRMSEERLRLATEVADIGVWERDIQSHTLRWDREMFEIYGLPPNPEGRTTYEDWRARVMPEDLADQEARLKHTISTGGRDQREFRIIRASDHAVRVIQAAEMVVMNPEGQAARVVGINLDITERKQAEEEIIKLNANLQNRAAELTEANKELEAFSYSISHDLRAPLRAVDGFSRMVLEDYAEKLDADGKRKLGVIRMESQRMGRLIDDLLAFSRLGRLPIEPALIDMHTMAQDVYDELAAGNPERKLSLDLQELPPAHGSEALVRQVWVNLISNAIKFTRDREVGEIEIGSKQDEDGELIYHVKDNGAGFDMRHADKLFGVFQRLHTQEEFSGTGVGLALVQRIVHRHGGRIWAQSEPDHGAAFYFTLPNQKP